MKLKSLYWLTVVLCLTACSGSDDLLLNAGLDKEYEISFEPRVSDVPIRFAPVDMMKFTSTENGGNFGSLASSSPNILQDSMGIFCLAKYSIEKSGSVHTPTWSGKAKKADLNTYSIWKKNALAYIQKGSSSGMGKIMWDDKSNPKDSLYYPDNNWFAYGFLAYYPYTKNIVYTQKTITALIKIDGDDDVCYAMAKSPKVVLNESHINKLGFSKAYYDSITPEPGLDEWIYPYFEFNRLVSRVKFLFRMTEEPKYNLHVDKVEVVNFPCLMKVGVSRSSGDMKLNNFNFKYIYKETELGDYINKISATTNLDSLQVVEAYPELRSMLGNYILKETNGESISGQKNADGSYKYNLTTEKQQVGGYIMIPPVTDGHPTLSKMQVFVTLCDDAGNRYINKKKLVIDPPTGGYKIGKTHTHTIVLSNLIPTVTNSEIGEWDAEELGSINETLTQWERLP